MNPFIYFRTKLFEALEQRQVSKLFYSNDDFRKLDQALLKSYHGINPYLVSKKYLKKMGALELHTYGETPLSTMAKIAKECELAPGHTVIEMGAGRGRGALFLAEYVGCSVLAYEQIPQFVEKMVPSKNLRVVAEDMFTAPFSKADAIFLYGTMLSDEEILDLVKKFPKGVKIITVSYPLSDYSKTYQTKKSFSGRFPWGITEVYLNERTS